MLRTFLSQHLPALSGPNLHALFPSCSLPTETAPFGKIGAAYNFSSDTARAIKEAGSDPAAALASALAAAKVPAEEKVPAERQFLQMAVVAGAAAAVYTIVQSKKAAS